MTLPDVLRLAVDVVGGSRVVEEVAIVPPTPAIPVPQVQIAVASEQTANELRREVEASEYFVSFCESSMATEWHAHLVGMVLMVCVLRGTRVVSHVGSVREWYRFLGVPTANDAAGELRRLVIRLDDCFDGLNQAVKVMAGSPGGEIEEALLVARGSVDEAIGYLDEVLVYVRNGDPDAA